MPAGQLRHTLRLGFVLPDQPDRPGLDRWLTEILEIDATALASCLAHPGPAEAGDAARWLWRVLLLARALLQASRAPVFDLPTIQSLAKDPGPSRTWTALVTLALIDHLPQTVYVQALQSALRLCAWAAVHPVSDDYLPVFFSTLEKEVIPQVSRRVPSGKSTLPVLQVAHQRGIPFAHLGAGVYQLGWGCRARRMDRSTTERDSAMGARLSQSKVHTARLLRMAGLAAPVHEVVGQVEEALQSARRIGWPVVVKPADLDRGEGVTVDVATEDALRAAFGTAVQLSRSKQVIVERQVPGVCHRLFIANGKLLYAVKRLPMAVQGNGRDTVSTLVDEAVQKQRRVPPWRRSEIQPLDALAHAAMAAAGYTGASVPTEGAWVPLRPIESTAWGGVDEEVTGLIHPENLRMALAAADLFGLHVAGIDIISPDIARPWHENGAVINEVNFSPLLGGGDISKRHIPLFLDDFMEAQGRIPVEVFVGEAAAWKAAEVRWRALRAEGLSGCLSRDDWTLGPDGQEWPMPFQRAWQRARALLLSSRVEAIVLVMSPQEFGAAGVPFEGVHNVVRVAEPGEGPDARSAH